MAGGEKFDLDALIDQALSAEPLLRAPVTLQRGVEERLRIIAAIRQKLPGSQFARQHEFMARPVIERIDLQNPAEDVERLLLGRDRAYFYARIINRKLQLGQEAPGQKW